MKHCAVEEVFIAGRGQEEGMSDCHLGWRKESPNKVYAESEHIWSFQRGKREFASEWEFQTNILFKKKLKKM